MFGVIDSDDEFQYVWNLVRSLLPLLLIFVVFFIMYMTAPNIKLKIKSVIPGTLFTTIAFLLASWGFSFYVSNFSNYSATYGSIAGVIILIFWLYITGVIIILGAQINSILHKRAFKSRARGQYYRGSVSLSDVTRRIFERNEDFVNNQEYKAYATDKTPNKSCVF